MKPRTVAWLVDGDEGYGVRRTTLEFTSALNSRGWRTPILTLGDGPFAGECRERGLTVVDLGLGAAPSFRGPVGRVPLRLLQALAFARRGSSTLARALASRSAEVLHLRREHLLLLAGRGAQAAGVAPVWQLPNEVSGRYPFGLNRRLYRWACRRYDVLPLANSRYTASSLGNWSFRPPVLYLGVDPDRFRPDPPASRSREEFGIAQDAIVVGVFGRLIPRKGQDRVLSAVASLDRVAPAPVHVLLLGGPLDSAFAAELRRLTEVSGLAGRVHFLGNRPDPERYYPLVDIAVNSRVDAEPFGLSAIEAMMAGRPVLVHALGGPAETVIDGTTGWHVADASVESLASGLRRAIGQRDRWREMGRAAQSHATRNFSIQDRVTEYMALIAARLQAGPRRPSAVPAPRVPEPCE